MNSAPTFQDFWNAYALKRDRLRAERAWNKLSAQDKRNAIAASAAYRDDCDRRGISRMYAQGYLNNRRWEDDFSDDLSAGSTATAPKPSPQSPTPPQKMQQW